MPSRRARQFEALLKDPNLKSSYKDDCLLGVADAIAQQSKYDEAVAILVEAYDEQGDSEAMASMFQRLLRWSGEMEDTTLLDKALEKWIARPEVLTDAANPENKETVTLEFSDRDAFALFLLAKNLIVRGAGGLRSRRFLVGHAASKPPMHSLVPRSWFLTSRCF